MKYQLLIYRVINSRIKACIGLPSRAAFALRSRRTDSGTLRMMIAASFSSPSSWWIFAAQPCGETDADFSHVKDGLAMRWIPKPGGTRLVRPKPPYWNAVGRVKCLEVGENIS